MCEEFLLPSLKSTKHVRWKLRKNLRGAELAADILKRPLIHSVYFFIVDKVMLRESGIFSERQKLPRIKLPVKLFCTEWNSINSNENHFNLIFFPCSSNSELTNSSSPINPTFYQILFHNFFFQFNLLSLSYSVFLYGLICFCFCRLKAMGRRRKKKHLRNACGNESHKMTYYCLALLAYKTAWKKKWADSFANEFNRRVHTQSSESRLTYNDSLVFSLMKWIDWFYEEKNVFETSKYNESY